MYRLLILFALFALITACSSRRESIKPAEVITTQPTTVKPPIRTIPKPAKTQPTTSRSKPSRPKSKPFRLQVNQRQILSVHNRVRSQFKLAPLSWSSSLTQYSQQWANHLKKTNGCRMQHRSHSNFGENLFWASPYLWSDGTREIQKVNSAFVVNEWAKEQRYFNYQTNRCQPGKQCGHYTQIVWKDSKRVGCALSVCPDKSQVWVCSYDPPGNWQGKRPY